MIKLLRGLLDHSYTLMEKHEKLEGLRPLWDAVDAFCFSVPDVTEQGPHIRDSMDMKRYMIVVWMAVAPTALVAIYTFGWRAALIILVSYVFGGLTEIIFALVRKRTITEGFLITGLLFPLTLPPTIPLWMVALGVVGGTIFGKEAFGGTGRNIFNPALVGRILLAVTFPHAMTGQWLQPIGGFWGGFTAYSSDAITSATPLNIFTADGMLTSYGSLFFGTIPGCLGETCKLLILIGGVWLMWTKVANWRIPVSYLGSVALSSGIGSYFFPTIFAPPIFQWLSGGLLFGALFMATDPVSCPFTRTGKWIYGLCLGLFTVLIRGLSGYAEGVMFAILFMNIFAPLIDHLILMVRYKEASPQ